MGKIKLMVKVLLRKSNFGPMVGLIALFVLKYSTSAMDAVSSCLKSIYITTTDFIDW